MMKHTRFHKNLRVLFFVIALWGFFIESFAASFPSDKASFNQCWECIDQSEEEFDDSDFLFLEGESRIVEKSAFENNGEDDLGIYVVPFCLSGRDFCILYHRLKVFGKAD